MDGALMSVVMRWGQRSLLLLAAVAVAVVGLVPPTPAEASTSPRSLEADFVALVNIERSRAGLHALTVRSDIVTVARNHSREMADEWRLYHNPDYTTQITGWQRVSENVGFGPNVIRIHDALMASEGHRRNILDDRVTEIGVGVVVKDGRVWVTQNFRRPRTNVTMAARSSAQFGDVTASNVHLANIRFVTDRGIMEPCGEARFCPSGNVTRGEFATILVRAMNLPTGAPGVSRFTDVTGTTAAAAEALAAAGLTGGCGDGRFCPNDQLNRQQMATFFANALGLDPVPTTFLDVGRTHGGNVGALARAGIVSGCRADAFCPTQQVTRAQTASMVGNNLR